MNATTTVKRSVRAEQKERTRLRLIEATLDVIAKDGLTGTTMGRVASQAGLSQGLVNFHFESKDQLLAEALTYLTDHYRGLWHRAMDAAADDPADQLLALLKALLDTEVADHRHLACWFAYWGDGYARGIYRRIGSQVDQETAKTIEVLCVGLLARCSDPTVNDPGEIAANLVAVINGYWLMKLLRPEEVDLNAAIRSCMTYLRGAFPGEFHGGPGPTAALGPAESAP